MKITLFIFGLLVALIAVIIDLQSNIRVASIGYFLLSGAMMISSAIWRTDSVNDNYCRSMHKVFSALAEGGIDMDSLMKRLVINTDDIGTSEYYQVVIGRMLSKRQIIIDNGLVMIGEGTDATA
jgi:hypothetical protein